MALSRALELTIALPGQDTLTVGLTRLRATISDWRPFWTDYLGPSIYRWIAQEFVTEGGQSSGGWAALSPRYAAEKAAAGYPNAILVHSGALRASLADPDGPGSVFEATATSLQVGTNVPYGIFHQTGTRKMPARPPVKLTPAFMASIGRSLQRWIEGERA